jgi:hypothetical protein
LRRLREQIEIGRKVSRFDKCLLPTVPPLAPHDIGYRGSHDGNVGPSLPPAMCGVFSKLAR